MSRFFPSASAGTFTLLSTCCEAPVERRNKNASAGREQKYISEAGKKARRTGGPWFRHQAWIELSAGSVRVGLGPPPPKIGRGAGRKTGGVHARAQPPPVRDSPFTKREFGSFAGVLRPKVRDRYADESDALGRREDGPDQAEGDLVQPVPGFNARFH